MDDNNPAYKSFYDALEQEWKRRNGIDTYYDREVDRIDGYAYDIVSALLAAGWTYPDQSAVRDEQVP
jgi:hypothetical protein